PDAWLPAYCRVPADSEANIYLSAGIHGDEPAGPLAIRRLITEDLLPRCFSYWIVPCLNPDGFENNTRQNENNIDLNRDYKALRAPRTRAHIRWLEEQPRFDLGLMLHEDWEANGFYLYELNPDTKTSMASQVIRAVSSVCPIETAEQVDGREASGGMIRFVGHVPERDEWPEAIWLIHNRTRHNYTLEAPSDFPLSTRVDALVRGALTLLGAQPR
ncbi:MAG: M14 family metallocarboxypeptidase, partial [Verrucomicrobia bacterium]|nr:M14 family metallocarboxypeptidase [Verrucomicrobiota bacterium]